jgi:hypothetical protein
MVLGYAAADLIVRRLNMPLRYTEWLSHVFDHPVTSPEWFFSSDEPEFEATSEDLVELITHTMSNCMNDLSRFSEGQINDGLHYIFHNSCSNVVFAVMDTKVSIAKRVEAIRSIKHLYTGCFEPRCAPVLSHIDEAGGNRLNNICYMLWDVTPLAYWEGQKDKDLFYREVLEVLRVALGSRNIACVESALHGLGHVQPYREKPATELIQKFLRQNPKLRKELRAYAENASIGYVL